MEEPFLIFLLTEDKIQFKLRKYCGKNRLLGRFKKNLAMFQQSPQSELVYRKKRMQRPSRVMWADWWSQMPEGQGMIVFLLLAMQRKILVGYRWCFSEKFSIFLYISAAHPFIYSSTSHPFPTLYDQLEFVMAGFGIVKEPELSTTFWVTNLIIVKEIGIISFTGGLGGWGCRRGKQL